MKISFYYIIRCVITGPVRTGLLLTPNLTVYYSQGGMCAKGLTPSVLPSWHIQTSFNKWHDPIAFLAVFFPLTVESFIRLIPRTVKAAWAGPEAVLLGGDLLLVRSNKQDGTRRCSPAQSPNLWKWIAISSFASFNHVFFTEILFIFSSKLFRDRKMLLLCRSTNNPNSRSSY